MKDLKCDMKLDCGASVTHIDEKGWVYCAQHGAIRKYTMRCRQLKPKELATLKSGILLISYAHGDENVK